MHPLSSVGNNGWLVYSDKRKEMDTTYDSDIYAWDIHNQAEMAIAIAPGAQQNPAIFSSLVVWADNRNSPELGQPLEGCGNCGNNRFDIYQHQLETGKSDVLAEWIGGAIIYHIPTVSTLVINVCGTLNPFVSQINSAEAASTLYGLLEDETRDIFAREFAISPDAENLLKATLPLLPLY